VRVAGPSGMNAIAHCVEALYAPDANPVTSLMAEEGIRALTQSLPAIVRNPGDHGARSEALYGAWLAGASLRMVRMALHHKLCHVLGGSFALPHAETHGVLLPHVVAFNQSAAPQAIATVARALGGGTAAAKLHELAREIGAPVTLRELGLDEAQLDHVADVAMQAPYDNPRAVDRVAVCALLHRAFHGKTCTDATDETT
jgi:maleylacetate reductase